MDRHRNIFYTSGSHGNFVKFLFDCHDAGRVLASPLNENGNSHMRADSGGANSNHELCDPLGYRVLSDSKDSDNYAIVWEGFDSLFYTMTAYTDRGGKLTKPGINLLLNDIKLYEKSVGVEIYITEFLKTRLNFDVDKQGQPPIGVLRNYFLQSFYTYFNHILWVRNNEIKQKGFKEIELDDILDCGRLTARLNDILGFKLDIKEIHAKMLSKNLAYQQLQLVKSVLRDISAKVDRPISGLNVISEAYLLFCLDVRNFDIPFFISNNFYSSTKEIFDYIDHFPDYMKGPNKLFNQHYRYFPPKGF